MNNLLALLPSGDVLAWAVFIIVAMCVAALIIATAIGETTEERTQREGAAYDADPLARADAHSQPMPLEHLHRMPPDLLARQRARAARMGHVPPYPLPAPSAPPPRIP